MLATVGALVLFAASPPAPVAPVELGDPWAVLSWGDAPGQPGVRVAPEEAPHGPTALAAGFGETVYLADPVHAQVLVLGASGVVESVFATPFQTADLVALPDGRLLALDEGLERVFERDHAGSWRPKALGTKLHPSYLAVGPAGEAFVIDTLGRGWALDTGLERATPLGAGLPWHATGRVLGPTRGEVLVWAWDSPAELKGPGPNLRQVLEVPARLGLIRPIGGDRRGGLVVLTETLRGRPLAVEAQVSWLDAKGRLVWRAAWSLGGLAPANRYVALDEEGRLLIMQSRATGLCVWRVGGGR